MQVHPVIKSWNIKLLKLDRGARHKDMLVAEDFLEDFRKFLLSMPN